jgi:hypothetical protein
MPMSIKHLELHKDVVNILLILQVILTLWKVITSMKSQIENEIQEKTANTFNNFENGYLPQLNFMTSDSFSIVSFQYLCRAFFYHPQNMSKRA